MPDKAVCRACVGGPGYVCREECGSGGSRSWIELARCLERIGRGDTLVVVRIDRLARSLAHLLEVIERLRERGGHFRSLRDPIDTARQM